MLYALLLDLGWNLPAMPQSLPCPRFRLRHQRFFSPALFPLLLAAPNLALEAELAQIQLAQVVQVHQGRIPVPHKSWDYLGQLR